MVELSPWELKDTLRQMTEKFNKSVEAIQELQTTSGSVNSETIQAMTDLQTTITQDIDDIKDRLQNVATNVTAESINLGNVDNTSDMDKPVSTATRQAIDEAVADMTTSEEVDSDEFKVENLYDPEISTPIKAYIESRLAELLNAQGNGTYTPTYNIASESELGVIKSGDIVVVNQTSGKLEVPALSTQADQISTLQGSISTITTSLESNNTATSALERKVGNLESLTTTDKTSLVNAINELVSRINELDEG